MSFELGQFKQAQVQAPLIFNFKSALSQFKFTQLWTTLVRLNAYFTLRKKIKWNLANQNT